MFHCSGFIVLLQVTVSKDLLTFGELLIPRCMAACQVAGLEPGLGAKEVRRANSDFSLAQRAKSCGDGIWSGFGPGSDSKSR